MDIAEYKNIVANMRSLLLSKAYGITGNKDDAEDVVQEVCLRLWHMRNNLDKYGNVNAVCVTMVRNLSIDKVRAKRIEVGDEELLSVKGESNMMPDRQLEGKEARSLIRDLIKKLPALQQEVLRLKDMEEHETEEIVAVLGISAESVRNNLSRARKRLRELLMEYQKSGGFEL